MAHRFEARCWMKREKLAFLDVRLDVGQTFSPLNYSVVSKLGQLGGCGPKIF